MSRSLRCHLNSSAQELTIVHRDSITVQPGNHYTPGWGEVMLVKDTKNGVPMRRFEHLTFEFEIRCSTHWTPNPPPPRPKYRHLSIQHLAIWHLAIRHLAIWHLAIRHLAIEHLTICHSFIQHLSIGIPRHRDTLPHDTWSFDTSLKVYPATLTFSYLVLFSSQHAQISSCY